MMDAHWNGVWQAAGNAMAAEPVLLRFAIGIGAALIAVMALEGLIANLFPGRTLRRLAAKQYVKSLGVPSAKSESPMAGIDLRAGNAIAPKPEPMPRPWKPPAPYRPSALQNRVLRRRA